MGGDLAPRAIVEGVVAALVPSPDKPREPLEILLVGDPEVMKTNLASLTKLPTPEIRIIPAREVITMSDPPTAALRKKPDSSIRVGIDLLTRGEADAFFSAGNSGAVMATASLILKRPPGVDRPALAGLLPTKGGSAVVIDLGANVDCRPFQLYQFAIMGSGFCRIATGKESPRVGLLNNGEEDEKGNNLSQQTHQLLKASSLNYLGFIEGQDIFNGRADVVVCDGFIGNVVLKSAEGLAGNIQNFLKDQIKSHPARMLGYLLLRGAYANLRKKIDYRRQGGAPLLGVNGVVIIGHGRSDALAVKNGIYLSARLAAQKLPDWIAQELKAIPLEPPPLDDNKSKDLETPSLQ
jgi:glycerol-3-phosphate acyltransferase PlsX